MKLQEHIKIMELNGTYNGEDYTVSNIGITLERVPTKTKGVFYVQPFVNNIGYNAFDCCFDITDIIFLGDISIIDRFSMSNCKNLSRVEFMGNVGSIKYGAFECTPLKQFIINGHLGYMDEQFKLSMSPERNFKMLEHSLRLLKINSVTDMQYIDYYSISSINKVVLGESVREFIADIPEDNRIEWV